MVFKREEISPVVRAMVSDAEYPVGSCSGAELLAAYCTVIDSAVCRERTVSAGTYRRFRYQMLLRP